MSKLSQLQLGLFFSKPQKDIFSRSILIEEKRVASALDDNIYFNIHLIVLNSELSSFVCSWLSRDT